MTVSPGEATAIALDMSLKEQLAAVCVAAQTFAGNAYQQSARITRTARV
jgi:hypothetical protein